MKKSQVLGISVALAGNMALMMPQTASAVVACGSAITDATATQTCSGSGGYTQENVNFTGSKGVAIQVADSVAAFGACAYHVNGTKSFGMSTSSTAMAIRNATGKGADAASGCAN